MDFPEYPDSRGIVLEDKPVFDRIFAANPPEISSYTFSNVFAWSEPHNTQVSRIEDSLILRHTIDGKTLFLEPLGGVNAKPAIERVLLDPSNAGVCFCRIHAGIASLFQDDPRFVVEYDRDNADYLYASSDLIDLPGRKYDGKRNFIKRSKAEADYEYMQMTQASVEECHRFAEYWCEQRACRDNDGLHREHCAVYQMLLHFEDLGLCGGAIRIGGAVVAFELGEALNPETMVIHVEKADSAIHGIYQTINHEFCIHEARDFKYINREQDLGVPGLRKAKESYHPVSLVETYNICTA